MPPTRTRDALPNFGRHQRVDNPSPELLRLHELYDEMEAICTRADAENRELRASEDRRVRDLYRQFEAVDNELRAAGAYNVQHDDIVVATGANRTAEDRSFGEFIRTGDETEMRAQGVATGAAGGYFVPQGFRNRLVETMKAYGGVRALAETIVTDSGNDLPFPTSDDTANVGVILAENTQMTDAGRRAVDQDARRVHVLLEARARVDPVAAGLRVRPRGVARPHPRDAHRPRPGRALRDGHRHGAAAGHRHRRHRRRDRGDDHGRHARRG